MAGLVDRRCGVGAAAGIQRASVSQPSACFRSLIKVGVSGLYAMAWELTPGGGGIAPSALVCIGSGESL